MSIWLMFVLVFVLCVFSVVMVCIFGMELPNRLRIVKTKLSNGTVSYIVQKYTNERSFLVLDDNYYWLNLQSFDDENLAKEFFELKIQQRQADELKLQEQLKQSFVKSTKILKKG